MEWDSAAQVNDALSRAWRGLPFYRRFWSAHGYAGEPVADRQDFASRVPRVRKEHLVEAIRDHGAARIGIEDLRQSEGVNIVMTSGSSGFNTFAFLAEAALSRSDTPAQVEELRRIGIRSGMRILTLPPSWHALGLIEARALACIGAEVVLPWGTLAHHHVGNMLDCVELLQPQYVLTTSPLLRSMLLECKRSRRIPSQVFRSVDYLGCAGLPLTQGYREHLLDETGVLDIYERGGSADGMFGGGECAEHDGHHIPAELHHIEIVDAQTGNVLPDGHRGSVVVTNLTGGRSVYIRFEPGDVGELLPSPCPCGSTTPRIELYGRISGSAVLTDRIVTPFDVQAILDESPPLRGCSVQLSSRTGDTDLEVRCHTMTPVAMAEVRRGAQRLSEALGMRVDLGVDVSNQPSSRSWKS